MEALIKHSRGILGASAMVMVLVLANVLGRGFFRGRQKADLPVFPAERDVVVTLEQAHEQYPDSPFVLSMAGMEVVVLPVSEIEHIKSLPETELSIKYVSPRLLSSVIQCNAIK